MSKKDFELTAESRKDVGKGASRRLRRSGAVPAIVYGAGKKPMSIVLNHNDVWHALENPAFASHILMLTIGNEQEKVVLKDLHRHPFKKQLQHLDFLRIRDDVEIYMNVPLRFVGAEECPGVKDGGGIVTHHMNEVEVRCLPKDLPEYITVDLSDKELNDIVHLRELVLPEGMSLTAHLESNEGDYPVAAVHLARTSKADLEADAAEAAAAAAEAEAAEEGAEGAEGAEGEAAAEGVEGEAKPEAEADEKAKEDSKK